MADAQKKLSEKEYIGKSKVSRPVNSSEDVVRIQKAFLQNLAAKMDENNHTIENLADHLNVPYSYIVAIKNGMRRISKAEEATVEKFAHYLDVPVIQVMIWGGAYKPIDFVSRRSLKQGLTSAYSRMANDPIMTSIVPSEQDWNNPKKWSEEAKVTAVLMYEMIAQKLFLKHANMDMDKETEKLFLNYKRK